METATVVRMTARTVKWVRAMDSRTHVVTWTSKCGRFVVTRRTGGWSSTSARFYVLTSNAFKIPRSMRTWDTLRDAQDWAEMEVNPDWEPA